MNSVRNAKACFYFVRLSYSNMIVTSSYVHYGKHLAPKNCCVKQFQCCEKEFPLRDDKSSVTLQCEPHLQVCTRKKVNIERKGARVDYYVSH